jgi:hypothetical protein
MRELTCALVILAVAILLGATSIADAKQWGRGLRPAPGIGRCGYNIALDCKGAKKIRAPRMTNG